MIDEKRALGTRSTLEYYAVRIGVITAVSVLPTVRRGRTDASNGIRSALFDYRCDASQSISVKRDAGDRREFSKHTFCQHTRRKKEKRIFRNEPEIIAGNALFD